MSTLAALRRRGLRTGLISDCTHELPAFLPRLPIASLLDVRVLSVEVGRCKPDPELYLAACRRLGLAPEDCLYVGDGGSQELTGAERAGLSAARLAAPDLTEHMVFNADLDWVGPVLGSLREVLDLVDNGPVVDALPVSAGAPGADGTVFVPPAPPVSPGAARLASRTAGRRRRAARQPG